MNKAHNPYYEMLWSVDIGSLSLLLFNKSCII